MTMSIDLKSESINLEGSDRAALLGAALKNHTARLGVIGMGYVGLPMAIEFTRAV
jgi:hypothetical protein